MTCLLLLLLETSCAGWCMGHSVRLCAVQSSQRNKESRVNMLVNRMAPSEARAENKVLDCCLPRLPPVQPEQLHGQPPDACFMGSLQNFLPTADTCQFMHSSGGPSPG